MVKCNNPNCPIPPEGFPTGRNLEEVKEGCNYFDSNSDVNNGYGCTHPEQEEKQKGKGCCFCFSCPLGTPADEESFEEPDIDWNGTEKEDVGEDDYIIIPSNCEN